MKYLIFLVIAAIIISSADGTNNNLQNNDKPVLYEFSKEFSDYWNRGKAEIAAYELSKGRYGDTHKGDAVLIFVVEPFLTSKQVKSDGIKTNEKPERVMKLIKTEKFFTGIYPYSIMTSTFYPLNKNREGLLKVSMSAQDWCGQVFSQINDRGSHLDLQRFSYFQKEGDISKELPEGLMEEELFTQIRIDPSKLPKGIFDLYPSAEYTRLMHIEYKQFKAEAQMDTSLNNGGINKYILSYTDLNRSLEIEFENSFPYKIVSWQETFPGLNGKESSTRATLRKDIHTAYWEYNSSADSTFRKFLGL